MYPKKFLIYFAVCVISLAGIYLTFTLRTNLLEVRRLANIWSLEVEKNEETKVALCQNKDIEICNANWTREELAQIYASNVKLIEKYEYMKQMLQNTFAQEFAIALLYIATFSWCVYKVKRVKDGKDEPTLGEFLVIFGSLIVGLMYVSHTIFLMISYMPLYSSIG